VWLRIVKTMGRLKFSVPALPVVYVIVAVARSMRGATAPRSS
jgi:hypothetical protein